MYPKEKQLSASESTVFQFNFKIGNDLHNIYATNGEEAKELLAIFADELLPLVTSVNQLGSATSAVAASIPLAPVTQQAQAQAYATPPAQAAYAPPAESGETHLCTHGLPMKLVPAGIARATGKPYPGFYACAQPRGQQCDAKVSTR